ncbi:hypothetical protein [Candidatus Carsonella ruddii]|uniref:Putative F0F1-type ATP synthase delta subunit n=1 Tax=Candidatus Carsonella ruddii PC isolate NHV TaxID=1202540 RepID=J3YQJ9_CARRU|nr:hypothetical protein [Candidatus Carsonella ruddii]AFP84233.1 putative F0F1-type ATP synthase delta subunit [Candidatus Carsonella ruddii PC isolate NHV]
MNLLLIMFNFLNKFLNFKKRFFYIILMSIFSMFIKYDFTNKKKKYTKIIVNNKFESYILKLIIKKK